MEPDEIDELVTWQLAGARLAPVIRTVSFGEKCPLCKMQWHGLSTPSCPGIFDTPPSVGNSSSEKPLA